MKKHIAMSEIYLSLMLTDGILTYLTVDFSEINNPLTKIFNLGTSAIIIANLIVFLMYAYSAYYLYSKYKTRCVKANSALEYACILLYDRSDKPIWILYKTPKHIAPVIAVFAFSFIYSMPIAKIVLILEKVGYLIDIDMSLYTRFSRILFSRPDVVVCFVIFVILMIVWFKLEFSKSSQIIKQTNTKE